MGWIGTEIREIATNRLGKITGEKIVGQSTTLSVTWEDGIISDGVKKWMWSHQSDYEVFLSAGQLPAWCNLGG